MLILTRKLNQSIMIGDDIEIVVAEIKGDQIKLGVIAPKNVSVFRKEIYNEIKAANEEAALESNKDILMLKNNYLNNFDKNAKKNSSDSK